MRPVKDDDETELCDEGASREKADVLVEEDLLE